MDNSLSFSPIHSFILGGNGCNKARERERKREKEKERERKREKDRQRERKRERTLSTFYFFSRQNSSADTLSHFKFLTEGKRISFQNVKGSFKSHFLCLTVGRIKFPAESRCWLLLSSQLRLNFNFV